MQDANLFDTERLRRKLIDKINNIVKIALIQAQIARVILEYHQTSITGEQENVIELQRFRNEPRIDSRGAQKLTSLSRDERGFH